MRLFCGFAAESAAKGGEKSTQSVPSRQGQTFHEMESSKDGEAADNVMVRSAKLCCGSNKDSAAKGGERI